MATISLRAYYREIESLIERGRTKDAIAHCRQILKFYPKSIDTYRLLAKAYLESQRYSEAADVLQRVLSTIPDDFISQIGMSIIREDEGNLDAALWHMERAFEAQPSNVAVQDELRRLYGRRDGMQPAKIRLTRGALVRMYARGELFQQAIAEARLALVEQPDRVDLEVILARMYYLSNQKSSATEICSRLLEKLPFCYEANKILSEALPGTPHENEGKIYQQRIIALDPYLAHVPQGATSSVDAPEDAIIIETLEPIGGEDTGDHAEFGGAEEESLPDWLAALETREKPTDEIARLIDKSPQDTAIRENTTAEEIVPNEEDQIPEWMKEAGWQPAESDTEENASVFDEAAEELVSEAEIPEWLQEIAPAEETPGILDDSEKVESEEDTAWLESILSGESDQESQAKDLEPEAFYKGSPFEEIIDKFDNDLSTRDEAEESGDLAKEIGSVRAEAESIEPEKEKDKLDAAEQDEGVPDWLAGMAAFDEEAGEAETTAVTPADNEWLRNLSAEEESPVEAKAEETLETPGLPDLEPEVPEMKTEAPEGIEELKPGELEPEVPEMESEALEEVEEPEPTELEPEVPEMESESFEEVEEPEPAGLEPEIPQMESVALDELEELEPTEPEREIAEIESEIVEEVEEPEPSELEPEVPEIETEASEGLEEEEPSYPESGEDEGEIEADIFSYAKNKETESLSADDFLSEIEKSMSHEQDATQPTRVSQPPFESESDSDDFVKRIVDEIVSTDEEVLISGQDGSEEPPFEIPETPQEISDLEGESTPEETIPETISEIDLDDSGDLEIPDWLQESLEKDIGEGVSSDEEDAVPAKLQTDSDELTEELLASLEDDEDLAWLKYLDEPIELEETPETPAGEQEKEMKAEGEPSESEFGPEKHPESISLADAGDLEAEIVQPEQEDEFVLPGWLTEDIGETEAPTDEDQKAEIESPPAEGSEWIKEESLPEALAAISEEVKPLAEPETESEGEEEGLDFDTDIEGEAAAEFKSRTPEADGPIDAEPPAEGLIGEEPEIEDVPDWLMALAEDDEPKPIEAAPEEDAIPEWLSDLDEEIFEESVEEISTTSMAEEPSELVEEETLTAEEFLSKVEEESTDLSVEDTSPVHVTAPPEKSVPSDGSDLYNAQAAMESHEVETALSYYNLLIGRGEALEDTIHDLREALYHYPIEISLWQALGDAYMRNNQMQEALDAYTKAEELMR